MSEGDKINRLKANVNEELTRRFGTFQTTLNSNIEAIQSLRGEISSTVDEMSRIFAETRPMFRAYEDFYKKCQDATQRMESEFDVSRNDRLKCFSNVFHSEYTTGDEMGALLSLQKTFNFATLDAMRENFKNPDNTVSALQALPDPALATDVNATIDRILTSRVRNERYHFAEQLFLTGMKYVSVGQSPDRAIETVFQEALDLSRMDESDRPDTDMDEYSLYSRVRGLSEHLPLDSQSAPRTNPPNPLLLEPLLKLAYARLNLAGETSASPDNNLLNVLIHYAYRSLEMTLEELDNASSATRALQQAAQSSVAPNPQQASELYVFRDQMHKELPPLIERLQNLWTEIRVRFSMIQKLLNALDTEYGGHESTLETLKGFDFSDADARNILSRDDAKALAMALPSLRRQQDDKRTVLDVFDQVLPELRAFVGKALDKFKSQIK